MQSRSTPTNSQTCLRPTCGRSCCAISRLVPIPCHICCFSEFALWTCLSLSLLRQAKHHLYVDAETTSDDYILVVLTVLSSGNQNYHPCKVGDLQICFQAVTVMLLRLRHVHNGPLWKRVRLCAMRSMMQSMGLATWNLVAKVL